MIGIAAALDQGMPAGQFPVDLLHMLYNEKERNYRSYKAREYAMVTILYRDVVGITERGIRDNLIRDMPAVTLGRANGTTDRSI